MKNNKRKFFIYLILLTALLVPEKFLSQVYSDSFAARKMRYLQSVSDSSDWPAKGGAFRVIARLETGLPVDIAMLESDIKYVQARHDCSDFLMAGFIRAYYMYSGKSALAEDMRQAIKDLILGFKYWIDEPGTDSMCYWSENHQILFHSAEYLAGVLFPDAVFSNNGMKGAEHKAKGKALVEQWLDWRDRFGFSEWLSNVYYDEDLYPLLNLVQFAPDPEIAERAKMAVDQIFLNIALNSYRGMFTCTHGRTYEKDRMSAAGDDVKGVTYMLWGVREFTPDVATLQKSAVALATSPSYVLPPAIECIGIDNPPEFENYQRHGINLDDAESYGFSFDNLSEGMYFWGMGAYTEKRILPLTAKMWKEYNLYNNMFFMGMARPVVALNERNKLEKMRNKIEIVSDSALLGDAHTYTYRTPDYMLSSSLDLRPGKASAQSQIWAATLSQDAIVFTTHPGVVLVGDSPSYWTGEITSPRVAQYKNLLIAIYNPPSKRPLGEVCRKPFTHAWFNKSAFDRVIQKGNWVFGQKGDGYIALYSNHKPHFAPAGESGTQLKAFGFPAVWICQMGRASVDGSLENFIERISSAEIQVRDAALEYNAPGLGQASFGWSGPFLVNEREIPLRTAMRYSNQYMSTFWLADTIEARCGGHELILDLKSHKRSLN